MKKFFLGSGHPKFRCHCFAGQADARPGGCVRCDCRGNCLVTLPGMADRGRRWLCLWNTQAERLYRQNGYEGRSELPTAWRNGQRNSNDRY